MFLLSNDSLDDCPPLEDPASTSFEMAFVGDVGTLRQTAQQAQFYLSNYDKKRFFRKFNSVCIVVCICILLISRSVHLPDQVTETHCCADPKRRFKFNSEAVFVICGQNHWTKYICIPGTKYTFICHVYSREFRSAERRRHQHDTGPATKIII